MKAVQLNMARLIIAAVVFVAHAALAGVPGKITRLNGPEIVGGIEWKSASSQYEVVSGSGGRAIVPLNQVAKVEVAPPANLAAAVNAARAGDGSQADALAKIVDDYLMLGPDLTAMRALAELQMKRGEGEQVLERFTRVMENRPQASVPPDVVRAYWNVLLEADRSSELREQLKAAIEKGPRPQAAAAQMLRGEMDMRKAQYRDALLGGFLRTIVLYSNIKEIQPEALSKAAKCFDELGESQNAEKMRRRLAQEYPDSAFAK